VQRVIANDIFNAECESLCGEMRAVNESILGRKNRLTMKQDSAPAQDRDSAVRMSFLKEPGTRFKFKHLPSEVVEK